jgi:hypothetical protein
MIIALFHGTDTDNYKLQTALASQDKSASGANLTQGYPHAGEV